MRRHGDGVGHPVPVAEGLRDGELHHIVGGAGRDNSGIGVVKVSDGQLPTRLLVEVHLHRPGATHMCGRRRKVHREGRPFRRPLAERQGQRVPLRLVVIDDERVRVRNRASGRQSDIRATRRGRVELACVGQREHQFVMLVLGVVVVERRHANRLRAGEQEAVSCTAVQRRIETDAQDVRVAVQVGGFTLGRGRGGVRRRGSQCHHNRIGRGGGIGRRGWRDITPYGHGIRGGAALVHRVHRRPGDGDARRVLCLRDPGGRREQHGRGKGSEQTALPHMSRSRSVHDYGSLWALSQPTRRNDRRESAWEGSQGGALGRPPQKRRGTRRIRAGSPFRLPPNKSQERWAT